MAEREGVSRRDFLRLGLAAGPASLVAACGWDGGSLLEPRLRMVSRINDWVGEHILQSNRRLAKSYPVSARTPEQAFPAYSITFNRQHVFPEVPADWAFEVGGLVRKPVRLTLPMLQALPSVTYTVKHHCVEGWTAIATWTGVPVSSVLAMVEPLPSARYLRFDTFDSGYSNGWDLTSAMHPQTILAYGMNGRPLTPNYGAPIRLYGSVKLGYKLVKYVTEVNFLPHPTGGYWEDQGYEWYAGI